ncbi:hypothetical protein Dda_5591 [Drechslerella dactyloides]|uniref:Uncharacterized protein n=1 Tax=Drechslerella dactyloides TaxID=74499 RepID=A0AAD6J0S1_DREDA|nr:hypothetical protein Dda_5591 [Drechslerella dactyloides]
MAVVGGIRLESRKAKRAISTDPIESIQSRTSKLGSKLAALGKQDGQRQATWLSGRNSDLLWDGLRRRL